VIQLGVEDEEDIFAKSYKNISLHWLEFILLLVFLDIQENLIRKKPNLILYFQDGYEEIGSSYQKGKILGMYALWKKEN
jgi:hypothetical protein